jgi:hypothetical protein
MKLIMESWRKFLKEGISDVVYHFTNGMEKGAKILEDNRFLASGGFSKDVESELGQGKLYYFSTARTPVNAYTGDYPQGVIFKLDGRALAQKYKGVPLDYWASPKRSSKKAANVQSDPGSSEGFEAEDRILLDEPYIEDADRYIDEIHFAIPVFTFQQDFFDPKPVRKLKVGKIDHRTMASLEKAVEVAEQRNIPYYIHVDSQTWPHVEVGKKKALTSLSDFKEELQKVGKEVGEPIDTSQYRSAYQGQLKEIGEDEVFLYVQAAADILAGKGSFEGKEVKGDVKYRDESERKRAAAEIFRALTQGRPTPAGRYYRGIDSDLHNVSSNPAARKTLELLASLMRSTKKKTLKDFEAYLNQVYKQNHGDQ